jgi:DNA-directed RNA polymerase specialized sigma24 family protein
MARKRQIPAADIDASLRSFLDATDEGVEELLLSRIICEEVDPIIRRALRYKFHTSLNNLETSRSHAEIEEIYHDIRLHLLKKLRDLKQAPFDHPISKLESYISTTAQHVCNEYLRRKYPFRRQLKDTIRYHLTSHPELALWKTMDNRWLAGLAIWRGEAAPSSAEADTEPHQALLANLDDALQRVDVARLKMPELITLIFNSCKCPLELADLTDLIARLRYIKDYPVESLEGDGSHLIEQLSSAQGDLDTVLEYRQLLQYLWSEICQLPPLQRTALLFNLRSPTGINVITLLPATRVATFEQIAEALNISTEEFERLWSDLPMDDLSIAQYLGASRQQVINLRKNARERLARRLKAFERMKP